MPGPMKQVSRRTPGRDGIPRCALSTCSVHSGRPASRAATTGQGVAWLPGTTTRGVPPRARTASTIASRLTRRVITLRSKRPRRERAQGRRSRWGARKTAWKSARHEPRDEHRALRGTRGSAAPPHRGRRPLGLPGGRPRPAPAVRRGAPDRAGELRGRGPRGAARHQAARVAGWPSCSPTTGCPR